jgi:serine/threonine-protein kinase
MTQPTPFGRFLLHRRLAIGGMAEVWLAEDRAAPGHPLALKRLLPTLADDPAFVAMFRDEARIGALLAHPGIVRVREAGQEGASHWLTMDLVAGLDLRALLAHHRREGTHLPVGLCAFVAARAAEALDHAHRATGPDGASLQVVHCDLTPANVLLGPDGRVYLIDFGIARAAFEAHREAAALRGKFGYLAPEQAAGRPADRRADVFSLGAVLHEALTGRRLFAGPNDLAVLQQVSRAEVRPPSAQNAAVPPGLDAVVLRALARAPEGRFAWASELALALAPYQAAAGAAALAVEVAAALRAEEELAAAQDQAGAD